MYYLKIVGLGREKHYTEIILIFERQLKNQFLNVVLICSEYYAQFGFLHLKVYS